MIEKQVSRIRVGKTEMSFPHQGNILTAVHPFYGPANSRTLQSLIRKDGLKEPTSAELASFVHEYFNGNEPQAKEVTQIMKDRYFRGFTGILYVPDQKLAHFINYPEFDEDSCVDTKNLLQRIGESYANVPFEHLKGDLVDWREVGKHPYFVAWAGSQEGAEKLAELASKHPKKQVSIFVPNVSNLKEPTSRVAGLGSGWFDSRLYVGSDVHGDYEDGSSFGVLEKSAEGTRAEK